MLFFRLRNRVTPKLLTPRKPKFTQIDFDIFLAFSESVYIPDDASDVLYVPSCVQHSSLHSELRSSADR